MRLRSIGTTDVRISAVGFGTCQLQMVPEEKAIATLVKGFELGVNWVHADFGYGGVDGIIAKAIDRCDGRPVMPVVNGWGNVELVEQAFTRACKTYRRHHLDLFGLSCIDDDDLILKHDVWGPKGMVAKLAEMKRQGRIGATWCSTHGNPDYVTRLIESGAFDAVMLAYNPLGFHALTYDARQEGKPYENIPENAARIFPLAARLNVSLLVMKPLAGGLLVRSKAFRQRMRFSTESETLRAGDILRETLKMEGVTAVVPGTCSPEEAEENARAGHDTESASQAKRILTTVSGMKTELCSRCGECEPTCSKSLPISWMFREAYVWSYFADVFDAIDRHHYSRMHPESTLACVKCTNRTCLCPVGIDIPAALNRAHSQVQSMLAHGQMHHPPMLAEANTVRGAISARVLLVEVPDQSEAKAENTCRIWVENVSKATWHPISSHDSGLKVYLQAVAGNYILAECNLRTSVGPGERVFFAFEMHAPKKAGMFQVHYQIVSQETGSSAEGTTTLAVRPLAVTTADLRTEPIGQPMPEPATPPADPDRDNWQQMHRLHPWSYTPSQGLTEGPNGVSLPVMVDRAQGCRIWDQRGKEYIDYTMGWGTTILGYCHPEVQAAVRSAMESAPLLAYPRTLQKEVQNLLAEDFPGTTGIAFGKNGSDVCTLAARLCRGYTGRKVILYCGYHGWGDFWVEQTGFARCSVPERPQVLIHRFRFNDHESFLQLFEAHKADLAGVMLEPSGPWGGNEVGQDPDADQSFLELLRLKTREVGALLVFDEIITGYRYLEGSVQRARGVTPDLTCLGKAVASGMPLSALLGRGDILERTFGRTHYGPTFQTEAWSLAAAKATIQVFRREPVARHVWDQGEALRRGFESAMKSAGLSGQVKGPPFRMSIFLAEPNHDLRHMQRTVLQQGLLERGISIYNNGCFLPCYAHDAVTLAHTIRAFEESAHIVGESTRDGTLAKRIYMPLLRDM